MRCTVFLLVIIMVENKTDQKDTSHFFFPHKFSQMVILAVSKLIQDLGLEATKFSSSAGVKSDKALAPTNTSQSVQQRQ